MEFEILLRYINAREVEIKLISAIAEVVSDLKVAEEKIKLLEVVSSNEKIK